MGTRAAVINWKKNSTWQLKPVTSRFTKGADWDALRDRQLKSMASSEEV